MELNLTCKSLEFVTSRKKPVRLQPELPKPCSPDPTGLSLLTFYTLLIMFSSITIYSVMRIALLNEWTSKIAMMYRNIS